MSRENEASRRKDDNQMTVVSWKSREEGVISSIKSHKTDEKVAFDLSNRRFKTTTSRGRVNRL